MKKKRKLILIGTIVIITVITCIIAIAIIQKGKGISIIMYHGVSDEAWGDENLFMPVQTFEEEIKYLKKHNYETIFLDEIYNNNSGKKSVALTFDDGYVDFYTNVLPILKKYNMKANLFIITANIDTNEKYLNSKQIKEIVDSGLVQIGSHTNNHQVLTNLNKEEIEEELIKSKEILENITGQTINTISYPTGAYNNDVLTIASKYYKYGLTTNPGVELLKTTNNYTINRNGVYRNTDLLTFKKIIFRANIFRFGQKNK